MTGATGESQHAREELLAAVFLESPVAVLRAREEAGRVGAIVDANPAAAHLLGRAPADLVGAAFGDLVVAGGPLRAHQDGTPTEVQVARPDGSTRWLAATVRTLSPAAGAGLVLVALQDHTQQRLAQESLDQAARHDPLTGLINRAEILRRLAAVDPISDGPHVAVVFLDLDGFKLVNDTRGHQVGDDLLIAVAGRISNVIRPEDSLARLGGDEFVILCPRLVDAAGARAIAERVRATLDQPVNVDGRSHRLSMSVGIAAAPADAVRPTDLLRQADMAMYRSKDAGRNTIRYHSLDVDAALVTAERIREDLGVALDRGHDAPATRSAPEPRAGLVLHFQPIVEIASGRVAYVEALARLRGSDGAIRHPTEFLPVAARAGYNGALSEWVLRSALRQRAAWRSAGVDVPVGVNLAPGQVVTGTFVRDAIGIIAEERDVAAGVVFEVGEFGLLEATGPAQLTLRRLHTSGVGLAIDHFGTGHSSLGALRFLGPHRIKVDRSFVASIAESRADRAIVTAAISVAHELGQRVVAQGVETEQQLEVLSGLGCDEAQGFLVARVLPADELDLPGTTWAARTLSVTP